MLPFTRPTVLCLPYFAEHSRSVGIPLFSPLQTTMVLSFSAVDPSGPSCELSLWYLHISTSCSSVLQCFISPVQHLCMLVEQRFELSQAHIEQPIPSEYHTEDRKLEDFPSVRDA